MTLKTIGAILVFLGGGSMGFILASGYRRLERDLWRLLEILDHMICQLQFRLTPLPQLCREVSERTTGVLSRVFLHYSQELEAFRWDDACACGKRILSQYRDIPDKLSEILEALFRSLGCYDLEGQLLQLQAVRAQCAQQLRSVQSQAAQCVRRYQTLGLCAGAGLAILLL